jgi:hypothetical protein
MIGQSLEQMRKDLRLMPTQALMQYKQNPSKQAIDGMPLDMLAGLELSRRAQLQQEQMAKMAPNPQQMPTVVDQAAMGLAGMAQQPTPQMPGAPAQFQSSAPPAPPQAAPQAAPPQQMAQAPQPPAQPTQPTQQQPQKLAVGGLASLGDMQDSRDQGGIPDIANMPNMSNSRSMYGAGQPLMLARGGIVAFKDNPNQPVSSDMPSEEEESTSTIGNFFRGIRDSIKRQQAESQAVQQRNREGNELRREINQAKPGLFEALTPTQRAEREKEVKLLQDYRDMGKPEVQPAPPAPSTDGPVKPSDIRVPQGGGPNLDAILKQMGSGGGGFDMSKMQGMIDRYMTPTEQETAYQNLVKDEMARIRDRQSPEVSEAERQRIIDAQFAKNQATSKPYYDKMQQMIDEERAANKARYADKDADAMIRAGLRGLSSRKPGMQGFFEGAAEGLDYHDKVSELESAANRANRQANMDLIKSRMSDEKGDRESAQRYFDSYQKNKRDAETYEISRSNILINAQKGLVDVEGKRERAGMGLQMGLERLGGQMENNALRNQLGLMKLLGGNQPKPLTVNEALALEKRAGEIFGNPMSPEFQKYVGEYYTGGSKQLALDLKNKRVTIDKLQSSIDRAKNKYTQSFLGGTNRSSSGAIPYDQAAADLGQ